MKYTINNQNQYVFLISRIYIYIYIYIYIKEIRLSIRVFVVAVAVAIAVVAVVVVVVFFCCCCCFIPHCGTSTGGSPQDNCPCWGTEHLHSLETTQFALLVVRDSWTLSLVSFYKVSVKHLEYFCDCMETLKQLSETT